MPLRPVPPSIPRAPERRRDAPIDPTSFAPRPSAESERERSSSAITKRNRVLYAAAAAAVLRPSPRVLAPVISYVAPAPYEEEATNPYHDVPQALLESCRPAPHAPRATSGALDDAPNDEPTVRQPVLRMGPAVVIEEPGPDPERTLVLAVTNAERAAAWGRRVARARRDRALILCSAVTLAFALLAAAAFVRDSRSRSAPRATSAAPADRAIYATPAP